MRNDFFECYNSLYIAEVKENTKNLQINKSFMIRLTITIGKKFLGCCHGVFLYLVYAFVYAICYHTFITCCIVAVV